MGKKEIIFGSQQCFQELVTDLGDRDPETRLHPSIYIMRYNIHGSKPGDSLFFYHKSDN